MTKDTFYREMTNNQLQAVFELIEKNIEFDSTEGMIREKELIQNVAKERQIELGNSFSEVKGYIEFGMIDNKK